MSKLRHVQIKATAMPPCLAELVAMTCFNSVQGRVNTLAQIKATAMPPCLAELVAMTCFNSVQGQVNTLAHPQPHNFASPVVTY